MFIRQNAYSKVSDTFIDYEKKLKLCFSTRPQVRIVSFYFTGNYNIEQNKTMNVNSSQKHGPILHYVTQVKSRIT